MSAAAKPFEIVLRGGVPVVYAATPDAWRAGLAAEGIQCAAAALNAARGLRNIHTHKHDQVAAAMLVDRAIELVDAVSELLEMGPASTSDAGREERLAAIVLGREEWLVGTYDVAGELVPAGRQS